MKQETKEVGIEKRSMRTNILIAVAIILCFGFAWFIFGRAVPAKVEKVGNGSSPLVLAEKNNITIDDQLFGNTVEVNSLDLSKDSWVAIHEDSDGKPGNIIGAGWFPMGVSSGIIELQRATVDGGTYYAMLHSDNQPRGEDGHKVFDSKIDVPMTNEASELIMVKFMTTASPAGQ